MKLQIIVLVNSANIVKFYTNFITNIFVQGGRTKIFMEIQKTKDWEPIMQSPSRNIYLRFVSKKGYTINSRLKFIYKLH